MAQAVNGPGRKTLTVERTVSFVVPGFVQVEVADQLEAAAPAILGQPLDVALVEDVGPLPVSLAALAAAEQGALVLAGLGVASNASALTHLRAPDLPMVAFLENIRGVVNIHRRGVRSRAEVLLMSDELRGRLARQGDGHR